MNTLLHFVGAGPGDPELITLKGARLVSEADMILYAGSLVNPKVLERAKEGAEVYDTAKMDLDEIIKRMVGAVMQGKKVVRLHTGDPSLYGAIFEQMVELERYNISFEVVPGVSAWSAAAAVLEQELTLPGLSQTVILTRRGGRTPVPERERLEVLAAHQTTMVIFLSIGMVREVVKELTEHYRGDTPAAVVYRATWPDQKILRGQLSSLAGQVEEERIDRQALIVVGDVLDPVLRTLDRSPRSKLYDEGFSHGFRKGKDSDE
jgi:precorrin-4/cobalt-precorrin-4 C11-methyltransferase